MGLLSWFGFRRGDYPRGNPGAVYDPPGYLSDTSRSFAGVTIDTETALTISAIFRGAHIVASTIGGFPIDIIEKQPSVGGKPGAREPREYATDSCLWDQPNPETVKPVFWSVVVGHLVLDGNAVMYVEPEADGQYSLWPILPERVEIARHEDGRKFYRVDGNKIYYDFSAGGNIIHIPGWGRDGLVGISPVKKMIHALGLSKATEQYASQYFSAGTTLGGILSTDQPLTPAQSKDYKDRWDSAHTGIANAHQVAVLSQGLKWQSASTSPEDSQMTDVRQFQVAESGRIVGTPEHLIGSHDKASSWGQGLEINNRAFMQFNLMDHVLRIEQTMDAHFLKTVNDDPRYKRTMKFNTAAMMRGTNAERSAFYTSMFQLGAISTNQICALEDFPPIGPEGDIRFIPGNNLVALDKIYAELQAPPVEEEPPPDVPDENVEDAPV